MSDHHLSSEALNNFKEAFKLFDTNGDGSISADELATVMRNLGQEPTQGEIEDMLNEVDADGNGSIDFGEFLSVMGKKVQDAEHKEELMAAFKVFDLDGDGLLSIDELSKVMTALGEPLSKEEILDMIKEANSHSDSGGISPEKIDYAGFVRMVMKKT